MWLGGWRAAQPKVSDRTLAEGRFKAPIPVPRRGGVNKLALNPMHGLLAAGCESGATVLLRLAAGNDE